MAGKRLLDAARFFQATRIVARQHINIRAQQLDVWSKTSTVAKAVKDQTDRVTLTVRAANALAQRFSEPAPTQYTGPVQTTDHNDDIPRKEGVNSNNGDSTAGAGLLQDHHYKRGDGSATSPSAEEEELGVRQEVPSRYPTPDGSIPDEGAALDPVTPNPSASETFSDRESEPPRKDPVAGKADQELNPTSSNRSTIPDPQSQKTETTPNEAAELEQEVQPDGINTDVFHSPRIAELLGKKKNPGRAQGDMNLRGATETPLDQSELHQGKDQDTFNVRKSGTAPTASKDTVLKGGPPKFAAESSEEMTHLAATLAEDAQSSPTQGGAESFVAQTSDASSSPYQMHESRVPSSRFGRLWQYGGLATSMAFGAVGETFRRATGSGSGGSLMLSPANMERLVAKLSRMRGAALKLGQMMSFQDSKMLPAPIAEVLQRVQDNADYMPASQRNKVLSSNLGEDWRSLFSSFNEVPLAAASIGQVHKAVLSSSGREVAVKIQYPGVATSISSDLNNLSILLTASRLLPAGLYLDKTIANARTELAWECDYTREASCQTRFRDLLSTETDIFTVPAIVLEACGPQVLTAELMHGVGVTKASLHLSQDEKDWIGTQILRLCLRELTEFKFMQTDPNWTNFLYNRATRKLELLDFGAAREFPDRFVDPYVRILIAAARDDHETITRLSVQLGYLTGRESKAMTDAHVASVLTLAEPFKDSADPQAVYDFRDQTITDRVRALIPVMVRERLAPPPEETYSLHRKLSGAFLLLARLGARVKCRAMFVDAVGRWEERQAGFGRGDAE